MKGEDKNRKDYADWEYNTYKTNTENSTRKSGLSVVISTLIL